MKPKMSHRKLTLISMTRHCFQSDPQGKNEGNRKQKTWNKNFLSYFSPTIAKLLSIGREGWSKSWIATVGNHSPRLTS